MAGRRVLESENDGRERLERQSKESRNLEAHCKGGQGPPRAVAPSKKKKKKKLHTDNISMKFNQEYVSIESLKISTFLYLELPLYTSSIVYVNWM
jgi:hypothetical protein